MNDDNGMTYTGLYRRQWQGQNKNLVLESLDWLIAESAEWPNDFASNTISFMLFRSYSHDWVSSMVKEKQQQQKTCMWGTCGLEGG